MIVVVDLMEEVVVLVGMMMERMMEVIRVMVMNVCLYEKFKWKKIKIHCVSKKLLRKGIGGKDEK